MDLEIFNPESAEKGYLTATRFMSPELLSRFEPIAREQLKQVVTNRVSQFFAVDSFRVENKDPLVVKFLGDRITYVGRTETEHFRESVVPLPSASGWKGLKGYAGQSRHQVLTTDKISSGSAEARMKDYIQRHGDKP